MKRQVIPCFLLSVLVFNQSAPVVFSQTDKFTKLSIENTSCEILNAITVELNNDPATNESIKKQRDILYVNKLRTQADIEKYIGTINDTLKRSKDLQEMQNFFWNTNRFMAKVGIDGGFKFVDKIADRLPRNLVTKFGVAALQKGAELMADEYFDEKISEDRQQSDEMLRVLIDRAAAQNPKLLEQTNLTDFDRIYSIAQADLPSLKREDLPAYNRVMTRKAFDYLNEHRGEIQAQASRLDELTKAVNERIPAHIDELKKKVDDEFKKVGVSIAALTRKQEEHSQILEALQASVEENSEQIRSLEGQMVKLQGDLTKLKEVQEKHSKLIAENSLKINILTGYMFQNLNTDQKLQGLKKGHFDSIFDCKPQAPCTKKQDLIDKLEKLQTAETIISVANTVTNALGAGFDVATSLKLLKGEDAKRVGKFIHYIGGVMQVGTGVAKIYAGDISGILNVAGGMGALFGSGPQKSPELQFLEQMYDQMVKEFANVRENLALIDKKIDRLGEALIDMYKSMMTSFQYVNDKLDRVEWKIDTLQAQTRLLLFNEYKICPVVEKNRLKNKFNFVEYSDFAEFYSRDASVGACLEGLFKFSAAPDDIDFFYLALNEGTLSKLLATSDYNKAKENIETEITRVFGPTRDLFLAKYRRPVADQARAALFFPVMDLSDTNRPLFIVSADGTSPLMLDQSLNGYINSEMVNQFVDLFLTYSPYFEISGGRDTGFKPLDLESYLAGKTRGRKLTISFQIDRLTKLLRVTNYAILQQSLISGNLLIEPTYTILFAANQEPAEVNNALVVLENNKVLAANFATYLLHKNLRISEDGIGGAPSPSRYEEFAVLFENVLKNPDDAGVIDSLNKLIYLNDFTFKVQSDKRLYITINRLGRSVDLLVPEPNTIFENQLMTTSAVFSLLETRRKLVNRLEDTAFTLDLGDTLLGSGFTVDDFKYFYVPRENQ